MVFFNPFLICIICIFTISPLISFPKTICLGGHVLPKHHLLNQLKMGLTISYRGTLRNPQDLELMLNDVTDKCMEFDWHFMPIHRSSIMPVRGVMITPPGSEPIWLTFSLNGHMYNPSHFIYSKHPKREMINEERHRWIFTKTQKAGVETHMAIIKFFQYLKATYFEDFELLDDSQYWETGEVYVCLIRFDEFEEIGTKTDALLNFLGDIKKDHYASDDVDPFGPRQVTIWRKGWIELNMN